MIAVGADTHDSQFDSSFATLPHTTLGDELPSLSCDLGDLNITPSDIDQLLLHGLCDFHCLDSQMQLGTGLGSDDIFTTSQNSCDLNSLFLQDTPRPRDLNLSLPGETTVNSGPSFFHTTPSPVNPATSSSLSAVKIPSGDETPPHSGGITPQNLSRAASPTWSESSGSMSTSSTRERHPSRGSNPVPRHKRPSHKRAEIKRRDKIKTCLDDVKKEVPSLREKGKLSESAILTKAAEYIDHLKDGHKERGDMVADLRREIECLSTDIHSFQENLPAAGLLKDEPGSTNSLDEMYDRWTAQHNQSSPKFFIFRSITSKLFDTFKEVVAPAANLATLKACAQDWQSKYLALPMLRKQILDGMLGLSRKGNVMMSCDRMELVFNYQAQNDRSGLKDDGAS